MLFMVNYGQQLIEYRFLNEQALIGKLSNKLKGFSKIPVVKTLARRMAKSHNTQVIDVEKKLVAAFKKVNKKYESTAYNWGKKVLDHKKAIANASTQAEKDALAISFNKEAEKYKQLLTDLKFEKYKLRKQGIERGFKPKSLPNAKEVDKFKKGYGVSDKMYDGQRKADEVSRRIQAKKDGVTFKKY